MALDPAEAELLAMLEGSTPSALSTPAKTGGARAVGATARESIDDDAFLALLEDPVVMAAVASAGPAATPAKGGGGGGGGADDSAVDTDLLEMLQPESAAKPVRARCAVHVCVRKRVAAPPRSNGSLPLPQQRRRR